MTRQVCYVFFGDSRLAGVRQSIQPRTSGIGARSYGLLHESPAVMTMPLVILAVFAVLLGIIGTPAWPWFRFISEW